MKDGTVIKACIDKYAENQAAKEKVGGEKQVDEVEILRVLELVGGKITEGAKAFLYKEYVWLTVWSCSFAIVLGTTVDLLEMSMKRAPTNFPYTATSYLTGSTTSIIAGYIGMRIAVYTNTRVTFTCAESCHRGFVTAFRGGQVLGFVLVGLAILNIMIIILIFKACWYNEFLNEALAAGMPIDNCPLGSHTGMVAAQAQIWKFFEAETYKQWVTGYNAAHPVAKGVTQVDPTTKTFKDSSLYWTHAGVEENLCSLWTATTTNLKHKFSYSADSTVDEILFKGGFKDGDNMPNCLKFDWSKAAGQYTVTTKTWGDAITDYETMGFSATARETSDWSQDGAVNDLLKY